MDVQNQDGAPVTKSDFKAFQDELRLAFKDVRDDITGLKGGLADVRSGLAGVRSGLADVRSGLADVRNGLVDVQGGLKGVQGDITSMRSDITGVQGRLTSVEGGLTSVWAELRATRRNLALEIAKTRVHGEKQTEILRDEVRARHSETIEHIDGFMSKVGTIDRAQVIADWRMSQLEARVDKIESRPS